MRSMFCLTIAGGSFAPWAWSGDVCMVSASPIAVDSADAAKRREFIVGPLVVARLGSRPTSQGSTERARTLRSVEKNFRHRASRRSGLPILAVCSENDALGAPQEGEFEACRRDCG